MPTRRSKKSAKVVPGGAESPSSARRRRRGRVPRRAPSAHEQARTRLVLLEAKREELRQCRIELAALREENTSLRRRLEHVGRAWHSVQGGRDTTHDHNAPRGGGRRTYRRRRRRRRRSRRSVPG